MANETKVPDATPSIISTIDYRHPLYEILLQELPSILALRVQLPHLARKKSEIFKTGTMVFKSSSHRNRQGKGASTGQHSPTRSKSSKPESAVNWRGHKSRSDWTIHVVSEEDGAREIYYVHTKVVDDLSSRRVPYFEPVFKDSMKQIGDRTSELSLPSEVAEGFDKLLDFLYCENKKQEEDFLFNVKNGLALKKVAEHFKIEAMQNMLTKFYKDKMTPFHVLEEEARDPTSFEDKENVISEMENFAKTMHTLDYVDEAKLEPSYLLRTLKKRQEMKLTTSKPDSENISCLIALCTKHYRDKMTRKVFYKLTQERYIPHIDQEASLQLLTVESEEGYWTDTDNFSTVQARCIQSLLSDWTGLRQKFESDAAFWKTLRELSPNVLGILLMQSTGTAQEAEDDVRSSDKLSERTDSPSLDRYEK